MKKTIALIMTILLALMLLSGCSQEAGKIIFTDAGWESIQFHNAVAMYIAEKAYGLQTEQITGSTSITHQALINGEIDVNMETWTDNIASYDSDVESGKIIELGVNFDDDMQGFYVPRYVIEGDPARGIEPMAPDLKTVEDLKKYKDLFKDQDDPGKGRIYGSIPGWEIDTIMYNKYLFYGLDKDFNYFRPGSSTALYASFTSACERGEPIVGYLWEPVWITSKYDFVVLGDAPYDEEKFQSGECECPAVRVTVACSKSLPNKAPEFVEFLKNYQTSSALTSEALAYIQDTGASYQDTAVWFMKEHDELLDKWLPSDKAQAVRDSLK